MARRAVLYARVSGDDRSKEGRNLAGQLEMARKYAQECGCIIVAELAEDDRGASGIEIDLPQLNRIREMAQAGEFDVLIVREIDRLSRKLAKQLIVEQEMKMMGVSIEYVLGEYPDTPEGNLQKHIKAAVAEYEREQITRRMVRGRYQSVKSGNVMVQNRPPFGYKKAEVDGQRTLQIEESEAATVRLVFRWYTIGDGKSSPLSVRAIARKLSELEVPSYVDLRERNHGIRKRRGYGKWSPGSVSHILGNQVYSGIWHYGKGGEASVPVPAIIPEKMWKVAQDRRSKNKAFASRNTKHQYLMQYRLRCKECNYRIVIHTLKDPSGKLYYYYRCDGPFLDLPCTMTTNFRRDDVDTAVWEWLKELFLDEERLLQSLRDYKQEKENLIQPLRDRLSVVENMVADNGEQLERLLDVYLNGDFSRDLLTDRKQRIEGTLAKLKAEQSRLVAMIDQQSFDEEQSMTIVEFTRAIRTGVLEADEDFAQRRRLVEMLNVTGELEVTDEGQKLLHLHVELLGEDATLTIASKSNCGRCPLE